MFFQSKVCSQVLKVVFLLRKVINIVTYYSVFSLFFCLERIIFKSKVHWCFSTWSNYAHTMDNVRSVFEVVKDDPNLIKVVLLCGQDKCSDYVGVNVKVVQENSVMGAYYLARCQVYLLGTSLQGFTNFHASIGSKHKLIQLWHGIPLKRIGMLFPSEKFWQDETYKYSATVCSSPADKLFMQQAFSPLPLNKVWQTGLPRNDFILAGDKHLPDDYLSELGRIREKVKGRFLVLYAPTWRDNIDNIYKFSNGELFRLNEILVGCNAVLAIRGHANVRSSVGVGEEDAFDNIIYVNDVPDANLLLKEAGALITDYSSIYIDFLITNRPIVYFTYDIDSYINERGFLYDLEEAFVCDPVVTFNQLLDDVERAVMMGVTDEERYGRVKSLFHQHDDNSGLAVVNKIKDLL